MSQNDLEPSSELTPRSSRRGFLGAALGTTAALACNTAPAVHASSRRGGGGQSPALDRPTLVGSANGLTGMKAHFQSLLDGADPLDVAIEVVKTQEADASDHSVGLGGLPNEEGVVQLDSAVMHGPTHNSGAVACIENILHPCEVARLVMERTDHCMLVGRGAYQFARDHGHAHTELLTEEARRIWMDWKESMSSADDRLRPARESKSSEKHGSLIDIHGELVAEADLFGPRRVTGTIHCSALSTRGELGCTTTTSGLSWKIPGRVGDSPIIGAGLYCDQEAGSAGATGRGESAILSCGSAMIVELMRQGAAPVEAGLEVLARIARQAQRAASWQPELVNADGSPSFNVHFYVLGLDGSTAGVGLRGTAKYAVADREGGPRLESIVPLL